MQNLLVFHCQNPDRTALDAEHNLTQLYSLCKMVYKRVLWNCSIGTFMKLQHLESCCSSLLRVKKKHILRRILQLDGI